MPKSFRILHISDLHERVALERMDEDRKAKIRLGEGQRYRVLEDHTFGLEGARQQHTRSGTFFDVLRLINNERQVDLLCFTGDVADWGLKEEYPVASTRFKNILTMLGLQADRLLVVPGNHDVDRNKTKEIWGKFRDRTLRAPNEISNWMGGRNTPYAFEPEWRELILERSRPFWEWVTNDLSRGDLLPKSHAHGRLGYRISLTIAGAQLHVIGLNSAWLCGDENDAKKILLTRGQIDLATRQAGRPLAGFRLALVHHPLGELLDESESRRLLSDTVDLLLHGHQHETIAEVSTDPDRSLRVLAAGSLYEGDEGDQYPNAFNVIDVHLDDGDRPLKYDLEFWGWAPHGYWFPTGAVYRAAAQGTMTWWTPLGEKECPQEVPFPAILTSFVGRQREIQDYMNAVRSRRLVTLTGMGGIGKTRLANEIVRRLRDDTHEFNDGIFFVDLAHPTENSEQAVVTAITAALGRRAKKDNEVEVVRALRSRPILLVLDNFETVIRGAAVVDRVVRSCPELHILATSQTRLHIDGEDWYEVKPMEILTAASPTAAALQGFDSFHLFRERARAAKPGWEVHDDVATDVKEILRLTEGIPLSIELVGARMGEFTLSEIASELRDRIGFLRRDGPAANQRQASMEACIDWTLNLLPPIALCLLHRLSVFAGGFFADDAETICEISNAADQLRVLMKYSLLSRDELLGRSRYRMLETVRACAAEKLEKAESEQLKWRHAAHFLKELKSASNRICGKNRMIGLARIDADLDNIFAGIQSSRLADDHRTLVEYSNALAFTNYLPLKGRFAENLTLAREGHLAAEALREVLLIARCDNALGKAYSDLPTGDHGENLNRAIACYEAALRVFTERDSRQDWAMTQNNLGTAYSDLLAGDRSENLNRAIGCYEAALRVRTERDFAQDWAMTQNNLGNAYSNLPTGDRGENLNRAIVCYKAALRVRTELELPEDWAGTQNNLGNASLELPTGDRTENLNRAIACYEAALRIYAERDFAQDWAMTQNNLGTAYLNLSAGNRAENLNHAIACYKAALRVYTERDFPQYWARAQYNLGTAYLNLSAGNRTENFNHAIACYEAALRGFEAVGGTNEMQTVNDLMARLRK
jgi:predicted ATPase/predicted phosphodiesterase